MDGYIMAIWIRLVFITSPNKHTNTIVLIILCCAKFFDWQEGVSGYGVHAPFSEDGYMRDSCKNAVRRSERTRQSSRAVRVMIKGAVGVLCQRHVRRVVKRVQFVKPVQSDNSTLCDFVVRGTSSKRTYSVTTHIRAYHPPVPGNIVIDEFRAHFHRQRIVSCVKGSNGHYHSQSRICCAGDVVHYAFAIRLCRGYCARALRLSPHYTGRGMSDPFCASGQSQFT